MTPTMLFITVFVYSLAALNYYREGRYGMVVVFAMYALSNIGFVIDGWRR